MCPLRTRMHALEFVLTLCETAPDMLRKHMGPIETVMQIAAGWVCHMQEDPLWHTKDDDFNNKQSFGDDATDTATAMVALGDDTLDRIPKAIGGRLCVRGRRWPTLAALACFWRALHSICLRLLG
jgi:hypothetical protein